MEVDDYSKALQWVDDFEAATHTLLKGHAASTDKKQVSAKLRLKVTLRRFQDLLAERPRDEILEATGGESSSAIGSPAEGSGLEACVSLIEAVLNAVRLAAETGIVPANLSRAKAPCASVLDEKQLTQAANEHATEIIDLVRTSVTQASVSALRAAARREIFRLLRGHEAAASSTRAGATPSSSPSPPNKTVTENATEPKGQHPPISPLEDLRLWLAALLAINNAGERPGHGKIAFRAKRSIFWSQRLAPRARKLGFIPPDRPLGNQGFILTELGRQAAECLPPL